MKLTENQFNQDLLLIIVFGCCFGAFIARYFLGYEGDHEQLPLLFRALDSSFIRNDFFTNTSDTFGPRYYFIEFIAGIARRVGFSEAYFRVAQFPNILTGIISGLFAYWLANRSKLAGLLAASIVLTIDCFNLGNSSEIRTYSAIPLHLAMPFLLLGIWSYIDQRFIMGTIAFILASFFHPLLAYGTAICLLTAHICLFNFQLAHEQNIRKKITLSLMLFLLCGTILWYLPTDGSVKITDDEFIHILAFFRHPHHYVPSEFRVEQYFLVLTFSIASACALYILQNYYENIQKLLPYFLIVYFLLLIGCVCGFIFVEIYPTRIFVTAQPFRFLYIFKWISFAIFAYLAKHTLETYKPPVSYLSFLTLAIGLLSAYTLCCAVLLILLYEKKLKDYTLLSLAIFLISLGATCIYLLNWRIELQAPYYILLLCILIVSSTIRQVKHAIAFVLLTGLSFNFFIKNLRDDSPYKLAHNFFMYRPTRHTLEQYPYISHREISEALKTKTPVDAIIIAPQDFGWVRFLANRALVVDYKAFPFQDAAMKEWHERLQIVYGPTEKLGPEAYKDFENNYRNISDSKLSTLSEKYGSNFAILFKDTPSSFPTLFENNQFKIVNIN